MKLGKTLKKEGIRNPFRPTKGVPRQYTVCKVVHGSKLSLQEGFDVHLDFDENPNFLSQLSETIPASDLHFDSILELCFTTEEHLKFVLNTAKEFFDQIHYEDTNKILHKYQAPQNKSS